jgi:Fe-S-cluster containining protein
LWGYDAGVAVEAEIRRAVLDAAERAEVREALEGIYRDLGVEIAQRQPRCELSGRCCRFEEYGHRLYVTTIELAGFVHGLRQRAPAVPAWDGRGCPFQVSKLCTVHGIRPFGCRVFFCDPAATQWQNEAYERFHGQMKRLHDRYGVGYYYIEWREALRVLGLADSGVSATGIAL